MLKRHLWRYESKNRIPRPLGVSILYVPSSCYIKVCEKRIQTLAKKVKYGGDKVSIHPKLAISNNLDNPNITICKIELACFLTLLLGCYRIL